MSNIDFHKHLQQVMTSLESKSRSLLTSMDFYHIGVAMHNEPVESSIIAAYKDYLDTLPSAYLPHIMMELTLAFGGIVSDKESAVDEMRKASVAVGALCIHSNKTCQAAYSVGLCTTLASAYGHLSKQGDDYEIECTILRKTQLCLLVDGLIPSLKGIPQESALRKTMELVQALTGDDQDTFLGETLQDSNGSLITILSSMFDDFPDEREYLLRMLESCPTSKDTLVRQSSKVASTTQVAPPPILKIDPQDEIQRRIQQVKDVFPDLGAGYVETVLSYFGGDVSSALTALLDRSSLPPALQLLDTKLPARRKETSTSTAYEFDDVEAKRITKERLATMEREQEVEAYALDVVHNEYDDDYDDQYDEMDADGDLGGKGKTYDDVDITQIKIFNRVTREAERDEAFWAANRNTNQKQGGLQLMARKESSQGEDDDDDAGSNIVYRGADKIKGGRVLGTDGKVLPRRRGGHGAMTPPNGEETKISQGNQVTADAMSKIQKRRKNDNKAKIGNHHRKDRAQKKQGAVGL